MQAMFEIEEIVITVPAETLRAMAQTWLNASVFSTGNVFWVTGLRQVDDNFQITAIPEDMANPPKGAAFATAGVAVDAPALAAPMREAVGYAA